MDTDDKQLLLLEHLDEFRRWSYVSLVAAIGRTRAEHDCLKHFEATHDDGTEYQIEINVFWDGKSGGDVRVCADITAAPPRPWLGFLPIYTSDASNSFIMNSDGKFIGG